jgi:hypothetical protein
MSPGSMAVQSEMLRWAAPELIGTTRRKSSFIRIPDSNESLRFYAATAV